MDEEYSDSDGAYVEDGNESPSVVFNREDRNSPRENSNRGTTTHSLGRSLKFNDSDTVGRDRCNDSTSSSSIRKKVRKHKGVYCDFYNTIVEEATGAYIQPHDKGVEPPSQIGALTWTSFEKEVFFKYLSTLGKDDIRGIAAAIGSKSETEVHQYIRLLEDGVLEAAMTQDREDYSVLNIPAACEVSKECEAILEIAADSLAKEQAEWEMKRETKKHGNYCLLTDEVAQEVEDILNTRETQSSEQDLSSSESDGSGQVEETDTTSLPVPAAELLNLENWLELSRHFMWDDREGADKWTNIAKEDETPSIYNTAFQDFHNLTVSLTRRLLQATIFQAQSRLRARDKDTPSATIYSVDVRAAMNILRLSTNRRRFWSTMPRRHGLKVYVREDKSKRSAHLNEEVAKDYRYGNLVHLSYDEVEARLGNNKNREEATHDDAMETIEDESEVLDIYDDSDMWTEVSYTADEDDGHLDSDGELEDETFREDADDRVGSNAIAVKKRDVDREIDAQMEASDRHASMAEEAALWSMFDMSPSMHIKEEDVKSASYLHSKRKTKRADRKDWREATSFVSEWERATGQADAEEFVAMHKRGDIGRKRRKLHQDQIGQRPKRRTRSRQELGESYESSDDEVEDADETPQAPSPAQYHTVVWAGGDPAYPVPDNVEGSVEMEADRDLVISRTDVNLDNGRDGRSQPPAQDPEEVFQELRAQGRTSSEPRTRSRSSRSRTRSMADVGSGSASSPQGSSRSGILTGPQRLSGPRVDHTSVALSQRGDSAPPTTQHDGANTDVEMESAGDAHSDSSSDVDISRRATPAHTVAPSRQGSDVDTESDGADQDAFAIIRRMKRPQRREERRKRHRHE